MTQTNRKPTSQRLDEVEGALEELHQFFNTSQDVLQCAALQKAFDEMTDGPSNVVYIPSLDKLDEGRRGLVNELKTFAEERGLEIRELKSAVQDEQATI